MNKLYLFAAGISGAIIGSAITFVITKTVVKKNYEKMANEAISQYKAKDDVVDVAVKESEKDFSKYNTTTVEIPKNVKEKPVDKSKPFVITRDEFKSLGDEYEEIALYYYADDVLADDITNDVIKEKDWPKTVGTDFPNCFGYDEDPDLVYVQNDKLKVKYEIARSLKYYYLDEVGK